jgi:type I restriction enzyme S subunit
LEDTLLARNEMQAKIPKYMNTTQKTGSEDSFKKTEIVLIPKDWQVVRLGEIGEFQYGFTASATEDPIGPKFLRITDIKDEGKVSWEDVPFCKIHKDEFEKYQLKDGDILIARIGATTGKTCIVRNNPEAIFASYLIRLQVKNVASPSFVYYLTNASIYWAQINANKEGKLKKGVSASFLKTLEIPLPPLFEQQRIAKVLGTVQRAIEQQEKIVEATKNLRKSLMQKLFTEGLYGEEQKETEIGFIPKNWTAVPLEDIAEFQYGYTATAMKEDAGPRFLRITDISDYGKIIWEKVPYCEIRKEEIQKYKLMDGDILVARIGATTGKACMIKEAPETVFGSYLIRILLDKDRCCPEYVYYFTNTSPYWSQINANKEGKLKKGVSASFLKTLKIPLPPIDEQKEVAHMLNAVDNKIEVEEKRKASLKELFNTMLHKLMTGEIRLKDVEV